MNKLQGLFLTAALSVAAFLPNITSADLAGVYVDIANGYRQDNFRAHLNTLGLNKALIEDNAFKGNDISLYQLGAKAEAVVCNFFARGEAYWGWSDSGKYREVSRFLEEMSLRSRGDLRKGRTRDFSVGGGYYLSFCGLFHIGPSGGWSYQHQEFTVKHARAAGCTDTKLDGLQYSNRWEGPWAGLDAKLAFCGFEVRGGYAYHWAKWRGKWFLKQCKPIRSAVSEVCTTNNAHGQSVYLDAIWSLLPFVELGIGLKWQRWEAKNGHERSKGICYDFVDGALREVDRVKNATWESYSVSLLLGVSF